MTVRRSWGSGFIASTWRNIQCGSLSPVAARYVTFICETAKMKRSEVLFRLLP